jgi:heat shock protein HslJ
MMMRWAVFAMTMALAGCGQQGGAPAELTGRWEVQQIAGASLGEGVDVWIEIDAAEGQVQGFTGCNNFSADAEAFGRTIAFTGLTEEVGECADAAALTDETRFLRVLPHIARQRVRGNALEFYDGQQGSEALLRLRRQDIQGG